MPVLKTEPGATVANGRWPPLLPHRFSVKQYHRMIETGVLTENDRVELLDGWILPKMPHKPPHDGTVLLVQTELLARVPADQVVRIQSAITLSESEPEPDVAVARGPARRYMRSHPRPRDIALLVEVADTTLAYDRTFKGPLYAQARIPVYWIVNLPESRIEVYTEPRSGQAPAYRRQRDFSGRESVPLVIGGRVVARIPVLDLLP
jgi:Uma2 family endonuclease